MDVYHLKQFIAVAETGSFRKAGESLLLSESSISYTVRRMEREYGVSFFDRTGGKAVLNQYGQAFLEHARMSVRQDEFLRRRIEEIREMEKKRIRFGIYSDAFSMFVMPAIRSDLPEYRFETEVLMGKKAVEMLLDGGLDAAILLDPPADDRLVERTVYREKILVIVPPATPLVLRSELTMVELADRKICIPTVSSVYAGWYWSLLTENGFPSQQTVTLSLEDHLRGLATADYCSFTTNLLASFVPSPARRVTIPLVDPLAAKKAKLCYRKDRKEEFQPLADYMKHHGAELIGNPHFIISGSRAYGK